MLCSVGNVIGSRPNLMQTSFTLYWLILAPSMAVHGQTRVEDLSRE